MNIAVEKTAKAYAKEEITTHAPAEKVYRILSDINHWPDWQSNVSWAELQGPPEPEAGQEFRWKAGGLKIKSRLHTVTPSTEFGWTGRIGWITAIHNWTFTDQGDQCTVTVEESLHGFLSGTMKKSLSKGLRQNLRELKAEAER